MPREPLLDRIDALAPRFAAVRAGVDAVPRGVLFSEMLFLLAALGEPPPARLVESGRARGQSTLLLARMLPETRIISVERHEDEEARIACERLAGCANVRLVTGDARRELPRRVRAGDAVLIDGPKGWRAVRLALRLLHEHAPRAVFVHDCERGTPWRRFLERHLPGARFSDDPRVVAATRAHDAPVAAAGGAWRPHHFHGRDQESYGPTLAWLPPIPRHGGWRRRLALERAALRDRLGAEGRRRRAGARTG